MTRGKTATFIRCKIRNAGRSHFQIAPQVELELTVIQQNREGRRDAGMGYWYTVQYLNTTRERIPTRENGNL
jgi:hypothetical protein